MLKESKNDKIISKYFINKSIYKQMIPSITIISRETGVSISSISRYSKKKGFYNFGELVASFNKTLNKEFEEFNIFGFDMFYRYDKIWINHSKSTYILSEFLKERLYFTNKHINILNDYSLIENNDLIILTTISGESYKIEKILKQLLLLKNKIFIITTKKINLELNNCTQIVLKSFKPSSRSEYDIYNSIIKMIEWLNSSINIYQIKESNKKY